MARRRYTRAVVRWTVREMRKGVTPTSCWAIGNYALEFRKGQHLAVLTIRGPHLPMPYHVVCRDLRDAKNKGRDVVSEFRTGRTPSLGVYRSMDLKPARYRQPQGGSSAWP